jgi:ubiquinone/menaquinone biosynthesis C-methylase UbiE
VGQLGKFDTDTSALMARISAHAVYGSANLEDWIFRQLDVRPKQRVLELGCGTGKQTIPLARLVGVEGQVTAVDIAPDSLSLLSRQARSEKLAERITLIHCGLDDTASYADGAETFDHTLACYSLYYANDPGRVLASIHRVLKEGGRLFFCGPAKNNNAELKGFYHTLAGGAVSPGAAPFMEEAGQELARRLFESVEVSSFVNPLRFVNATALYDYWRAYNLHDPGLEGAFKTAASEHFRRHDSFTTYKRVLGVLAAK